MRSMQDNKVFAQRRSMAIVVGCVVAQLCIALGLATAQQQVAAGTAQIKPVSMAHLYWHFLAYQNHLESRAAEQEARGKDGGPLRRNLQTALRMSDADFAPVRSSSTRLIGKVRVLDGKAAAIVAGGKTATSSDQLKALTAERENDINAEVAYIHQTLGQQKTAAFESFLTQLFSPKTVKVQLQAPAAQPALTAVQP